MVSCVKLIFLAALAVVSCQAKCFSDDYACIPDTPIAELEADDKVNLIPKITPPIMESVEVATPKTNACDCIANQTEETPKLGVVMKEVGNKYRVFTITIPMGTDAVETSTAESKVENVSFDEEITSPKDTLEPDSIDDLKPVEEEEEPKTQEKAKKEKVKGEKKKYKRDVGKKSVDKKSSQRKNKGQGKKKSKK